MNFSTVTENLCLGAKIALVSIVMTTALQALAAGNGAGGYGGPTLAPPTTGAVNQVYLKDLASAVNTCLVSGDPDRKIRSFLQDLYQTTYGVSMGYKTDHFTSEHLIGFETANTIQMGVSVFFDTPKSELCNEQTQSSLRCISISNYQTSSIRVGLREYQDVPDLTMRSAVPIKFSFSKVHLNNKYDKWGRIQENLTTLEDLKIVSQGDGHFHFVESFTNQPTPIVVSAEPLLKCLSSEIQRYGK